MGHHAFEKQKGCTTILELANIFLWAPKVCVRKLRGISRLFKSYLSLATIVSKILLAWNSVISSIECTVLAVTCASICQGNPLKPKPLQYFEVAESPWKVCSQCVPVAGAAPLAWTIALALFWGVPQFALLDEACAGMRHRQGFEKHATQGIVWAWGGKQLG